MSATRTIPPAPRWDLDSIFPGGSASPEYRAFCDKVRNTLVEAKENLDLLPRQLDDTSGPAWEAFILRFQSEVENIRLIRAFAGMLASQDVSDTAAMAAETMGDELMSEWEKLRATFEALSLKQNDAAWGKRMSSPKIAPIRFFLDEMREVAKSKMPVEQESLGLDLSVSGYHAWNRLYNKLAGDLRAEFPVDGKTQKLSMGQLATRMSSPDRNIRKMAFEKLTQSWESVADIAAMILNSQAGFRLALYKARKWESFLYEPLTQARDRP